MVVRVRILQIFGYENLGDQIQELPQIRVVGRTPRIAWRLLCRPANVARRIAHHPTLRPCILKIRAWLVIRLLLPSILGIIGTMRPFTSSIICVCPLKRRVFALDLGICETRRMDGVTRNIRYLLWKEGEERRNWETKLSVWLGCSPERAVDLLEGDGEALTAKEGEILAKKTGLKIGELSGDLLAVHGVDVLTENIRHLIDTLPHGQKKKFAAKLGIDVTTVSRWLNGAQRPTKTKLKQICNYFGLPPETDLGTDAVFLRTGPIGESQIKNWISDKIERLDGKTLSEIYPALRRLLK